MKAAGCTQCCKHESMSSSHDEPERWAAGKDLTYFTENKKMIEDKRRSTTDISTDPYLRCLVTLLQNSPQNPVYRALKIKPHCFLFFLLILSDQPEFSNELNIIELWFVTAH